MIIVIPVIVIYWIVRLPVIHELKRRGDRDQPTIRAIGAAGAGQHKFNSPRADL